jgi:hypothetical protein
VGRDPARDLLRHRRRCCDRVRRQRPAGVSPGRHPTAEDADDPLVADPEELCRRLDDCVVERVRHDEDDGRPERHEPADVRRERLFELDVQRAGDVVRGEYPTRSAVDDMRAACDGGANSIRPDLRWYRDSADHDGPHAVDRCHLGVVGRVRAEAIEERRPECRLVIDREKRVGTSLMADRGGPRGIGRSHRAEAAGAMGRQDRDVVRQGRQGTEGLELGAGQCFGLFGT